MSSGVAGRPNKISAEKLAIASPGLELTPRSIRSSSRCFHSGVSTTPLVSIYLGLRGAANDERAVVAGLVAHKAVYDIEIGRVTGTQRAVTVEVGMGAASLAGNGVNPLCWLLSSSVRFLSQ